MATWLGRDLSGADLAYWPAGDLAAGPSSGSYPAHGMVVVPASTAACAGIAIGLSKDLLQRAAEVNLKERRPVVVVPRETPVTRSHLEHLIALHDAGAVVLPASPGFYGAGASASARQLVDFVAGKVLDALGVPHTLFSAGPANSVPAAIEARIGPLIPGASPGGARYDVRCRCVGCRCQCRPTLPAWPNRAGRRCRTGVARPVGYALVDLVEHALALEQCTHLRLAEPAVPARRPDAADPSGRSPSGDGLGVDAEQRSHLARRQQTISSVHSPLLASTKSPDWSDRPRDKSACQSLRWGRTAIRAPPECRVRRTRKRPEWEVSLADMSVFTRFERETPPTARSPSHPPGLGSTVRGRHRPPDSSICCETNARLSYAELARQVGLSAPAVHERVGKLEASGVIRGYRAEVAPEAIGLGVTALIGIVAGLRRPTPTTCSPRFRGMPEIESCYFMAGVESFQLKARVGTIAELEQLIVRLNRTAGRRLDPDRDRPLHQVGEPSPVGIPETSN